MTDTALTVAGAAQCLARGELVAIPTETVYGLAAVADNAAAVAQVFARKGRPADHPLIVHVLDAAAAQRYAAAWPAHAQRLTEAFWPGPLTVVVPRAPDRAHAAAAGLPTLALRSPAHPLARALLAEAAQLGVHGLAAPSANRFGGISPTCASHVRAEFGAALPVLDGGPCAAGIESAIVDCTRATPALLRPGTLTRAELEAVLGCPLADADADAPKASGTLVAHYAPRAALRLLTTTELAARLAGGLPDGVAVYCRQALPPAAPAAAPRMRVMPGDARAAAQALFASLRALDATGAAQIWVETPPVDAAWDGVRDRLQRAAAAATPA